MTQDFCSSSKGRQRYNLANTLIELNRLDLAHPELHRAIECKAAVGHAATPWNAWAILYDLEQAEGNGPAAQQARQKAIHAYLAYRREGGENHEAAGRLALGVLQAIKQDERTEMDQVIEELLEREDWQQHKTYLQKLQAILAGALDPALGYSMVAELKMLLEQLENSP